MAYNPNTAETVKKKKKEKKTSKTKTMTSPMSLKRKH